MSVKRRAQFEGSRMAREIIETEETPFLASHLGHLKLVAGNMKRCSFPTIGGLYLNQTHSPIRREACDVITRSIAIFLGHPSNLAGQILAAALLQLQALMVEYALFPSAAKGAIAFVSPGHIETPCNRLHLRQFSGWWGIVQSGRDADEKRRWLRHTGHKVRAKGAIPLRMLGQPPGYCLCQRHLKIETRLVTAEDRKAKAFCSC